MDFGVNAVQLGFNQSRWTINSEGYKALREQANEAYEEMSALRKAMTTGSNIVNPGTGIGGSALRKQFLFNELELTGPTQEDAQLIRNCPMKDAESTLLEWSNQNGPTKGDGFVGESGSDSLFGVDFFDDPMDRINEPMSFLAEGRQVGDVTKAVKNLMDPKEAAKRGMLLSLYSKANLAGYFGDKSKAQNQFNGFPAQMRAHMDAHPEDYGIYYDCGGKPLDRYMILDASTQCALRYGKMDLIVQSMTGLSDTTSLIYPENRQQEGRGGTFGGMYDKFDGPRGPIRFIGDPMLQPNAPLVADGPGCDGLPRITADSGSLAWAGSTPFSSVSAGSAGSGNFWTNFTKCTDSAALATTPAVPTGVNTTRGGNNDNRLTAGTYYYAVSTVYKGLESIVYVYGAGTQSANTISGTPTAVAVTAGQVVTLTFDTTQITGIGTTYAKANIKFRVYRYGGPNAVAPTRVSQFQFLQETGIPTGGTTTVLVDNGMFIPGADNALGITTKKNGLDGWAWMNLLPLMQKELPVLAMAEQFCLLWFTTPLLRVRRHNIYFRNIGRAN